MLTSEQSNEHLLKVASLKFWYREFEAHAFSQAHRLLWLENGKGMLYLHAGLLAPVPQCLDQGWILVIDDFLVESFLNHYQKYRDYRLLEPTGHSSFIPLSAEMTLELDELLKLLVRYIETAKSLDQLQCCLNLILIISLQSYFKDLPVPTDSWEAGKMRELVSLMRRYYKTRLGSDFYAAQLKITPKKVNKICRTVTGNNVLQELNVIRLAEAKRLLLLSTITIKEIVFELGYESIQHFSVFFKSMTAMNPTEFRRIGGGRAVAG